LYVENARNLRGFVIISCTCFNYTHDQFSVSFFNVF